nr:WecB/TagA/CpsF family glycosyltransferase [Lacticaseibacillus nasuensis]
MIDARPDYVFAALGFPKQEYFLSAIRPKLPHAFLMGVGGSFDVLAGVVARAPGGCSNCAWSGCTG